jgi:hypothetical protein
MRRKRNFKTPMTKAHLSLVNFQIILGLLFAVKAISGCFSSSLHDRSELSNDFNRILFG